MRGKHPPMIDDPQFRYSASPRLMKEFGSPLEVAPIPEVLLLITLRHIRVYLQQSVVEHLDAISEDDGVARGYGIGNYDEALNDWEWACAVLN